MRKLSFLLLVCSALGALAADKEHGTLVREATLYVSPGSTSEKLVRVERGRDLSILERTNIDSKQPWVKVYVTLVDLEKERVRELTGWVPMKGVIATSMPNGDQIIFGEAVDSENQAEQRGGRKGAPQDAMRLYYRLQEFFSNSPLAPEAMWRSADIRLQLEKNDPLHAPTSRHTDPDTRNPS